MVPETALVSSVPNEENETIRALVQEATHLRAYAESRTIASVADIRLATDDLGLIGKLKRAIEERRKEWTTPINDHLKAVNEVFRGIVGPLEQADQALRSKILHYRQEEDRKAKEIAEINRLRQEAAQREASLNDGVLSEPTQLIDTPAAPPARVRGEAATLGTMKLRKWEVEDLSKVPVDYLLVDAAKVGKVVRAGIPSIPGIRIWEEETLRVGE